VRSPSGGGVAHMPTLLVEQVFDHLRLLLPPKEMASDRRHHLVPVRGRLLPSSLIFNPDSAARRG